MVLIIVLDFPFEIEKSIVDWYVPSCYLNQEATMSKEGDTIIIAFISEDQTTYNYKNVIKISYDNGNTFIGDFSFNFSTNICYPGDPVVAIKNGKMFHAGVVYCSINNQIKGEIYFCSCSSNCHNNNTWSCKFLEMDNWQYFKDKPWMLVNKNNILIVYTSDKLSGYPRIVGYLSSDTGRTFNNVFSLNIPSTYSYISQDEENRIFVSYNDFSQVNKIGFGILRSIDGINFEDKGAVYFNYTSTTCPNFNRPAKITNNITSHYNKCAIAYLDDNCFLKVLLWDSINGFSSVSVYNNESVNPMIGNYNNKLYILFQSITNGTIRSCPIIERINEWATFWVYSNDWGQTWSNVSRVSSINYGFSKSPSGHDYNGWIVDKDVLYALWGNDFRDEQGAKVYFTKANISLLNENKKIYNIKISKNLLFIESKENFEIYKIDGSLVKNLKKGSYKIRLKAGVYIIKFREKYVKLVIS
ncbi:MAG: hypothetical protein ABIL78_06245 [candidate division WOR-3 bacterium]